MKLTRKQRAIAATTTDLAPKDLSALSVKPVHFSQPHTLQTPKQIAWEIRRNFPATKSNTGKLVVMKRNLRPFKKWKVKWRQ